MFVQFVGPTSIEEQLVELETDRQNPKSNSTSNWPTWKWIRWVKVNWSNEDCLSLYCSVFSPKRSYRYEPVRWTIGHCQAWQNYEFNLFFGSSWIDPAFNKLKIWPFTSVDLSMSFWAVCQEMLPLTLKQEDWCLSWPRCAGLDSVLLKLRGKFS